MGVQVEGERLVSTLLINNAVEVIIIEYDDHEDRDDDHEDCDDDHEECDDDRNNDYDDNHDDDFEDFDDDDLGGCWLVLLFTGGFQSPTFSKGAG